MNCCAIKTISHKLLDKGYLFMYLFFTIDIQLQMQFDDDY